MFYESNFRFPFDGACMWTGGRTIHAKRCDDIEQQLAEHCLFANVSRHRLFGEKLYIVSFKKDYGGGKHPSDKNIAEALQITNDWVSLYDCDEHKTEYAVKEEELNCKHKNCDGRLEWKKPFDFYEAVNSGNPNSRIKKQLKFCRRVVSCYKDKGIILIDASLSAKCVADGLGICEESVIDVSTTLKESGITHIIIIEEE